MARFTNDWFSTRILTWNKVLKDFRGKPTSALEIGCFEGMATIWLLENILTHKDSHITVVDTFEGSSEHKSGDDKTNFTFTYDLFVENTEKYKNKITILKGKSENKLREVKDSFDLIYVDGSHETKDVLSDAILAWHLLNKNGIMIFDDHDWESVAVAVDIFLYVFKGLYIQLEHGGQVVIQKL